MTFQKQSVLREGQTDEINQHFWPKVPASLASAWQQSFCMFHFTSSKQIRLNKICRICLTCFNFKICFPVYYQIFCTGRNPAEMIFVWAVARYNSSHQQSGRQNYQRHQLLNLKLLLSFIKRQQLAILRVLDHFLLDSLIFLRHLPLTQCLKVIYTCKDFPEWVQFSWSWSEPERAPILQFLPVLFHPPGTVTVLPITMKLVVVGKAG